MTLPSIGDVVDEKFRIERTLGEGGTSTIYEVQHTITDKKFAIKWLAPELADNELAVQLFVHEAKVSGRFVHPNAVQIYDICRTDGSIYLLMEFLDGESLETRLARVERLSVQAAVDIMLPCAAALSAAHRAGIVHSDLKPSNIFLCNVEGHAGEVSKVLDFGISKLSDSGPDSASPDSASPDNASQPGDAHTVSGTPLYMAPEQLRGQPVDPRFDVYALGVVLYELVAGQPPFDSDTFDDLVFKIIESQPTRLDELAPVDPGFAAVVARAMARDVDERFATMAEFAQALQPFATESHPEPIKPADPKPNVAPSAAVTLQPSAAADVADIDEFEEIDIDNEFSDVTPWTASDAPVAPTTVRSHRSLGVLVAVGGALLLSWYTLARDPSVAVTPNPTPARSTTSTASTAAATSTTSTTLESEASTARTIQPAPLVFNAPPSKPSEPMQPKWKSLESSVAAKSADAPRAKGSRRASKSDKTESKGESKGESKSDSSKRTASLKSSSPSKRQAASSDSSLRADRSGPSEARHGFSLPAADLSRRDF
jgi:serine/threonine-protein kinase